MQSCFAQISFSFLFMIIVSCNCLFYVKEHRLKLSIEAWNEIPMNIRELPTLYQYKKNKKLFDELKYKHDPLEDQL